MPRRSEDDYFGTSPFPHCDANVLHAPRECKYCDMFPEAQEMRVIQGINFTGEYDPTKQRCPAELTRPISRINKWGGNVPVNPYQDDIEYLADNEKDF